MQQGEGANLHVHLCAHNVQLLAGLDLEKVEEVGDGGEQDGAGDADGLGQLALLRAKVRLQQHLRTC